jgi:hypothetical protein
VGDLYDIRIVGQSPDDPAQVRVELTKIEPEPPKPKPVKKQFETSYHTLLFEKGYSDMVALPDGSCVLLVQPQDNVIVEHNYPLPRKGMNGWQLFGRGMGLETRQQSFDPSNYGNRPAYYVEPSRTFTPLNGDCIVLSSTDQSPGVRPQLVGVEVVMFMTDEAEFNLIRESGLRPPYVGHNGTGTPLAMPPAVFEVLPETPDPESFLNSSGGPQLYLDHVSGWLGRYSHPKQQMPDYGREIAAQLGDLLGLCMTKFPEETRKALWARYSQIAIDLYGAYMQGTTWGADGGHGNGRLIPVLTRAALSEESHYDFSEVQQTYHSFQLGRADWRIRPGKEDTSWGAPYRQCCTFCAMSTHILALQNWDQLRERMLHPPLKNYGDYYANLQDRDFDNKKFHFWTDFARALWEKYGA